MERRDEIPGYVASALVAMRITAWELDVATGIVKRCGAIGGAHGDLSTLTSFRDEVHPDDRDRVTAAMVALIGGAVDEQEIEYRWHAPDDTWIWVEGSYRAIDRDGGGRAVRVLGVSRDISRRRAMETC